MLEAFESVLKRVKRLKDLPTRFDLLFVFTKTVDDSDVWMHDHEGGWGGEVYIAALAKQWKVLLANDDASLGIDAAYTRPGIVQMLNDFKAKVEGIDPCDDDEIHFRFM